MISILGMETIAIFHASSGGDWMELKTVNKVNLRTLQEAVNGHIESVFNNDSSNGLFVYANENGILLSCRPNKLATCLCKLDIQAKSLVGDVCVTGSKDDDACGLSAAQITLIEQAVAQVK
jgi:hypothetical protein